MKHAILAVLSLVAVLAFASFAAAEVIEPGFQVDVDVDDDVAPGESFTVEVDVENNNSADIENIEVEVVIQNIDDGDDLDDDAELDDLDAGDDDSVDFDFDVPFAVDDKGYDVIVTVTGKDASVSGRTYKTVINSSLSIDKETHKLLIKAPVVDAETLRCNRQTEAAITLYNIGTKDEDVVLSVSNSQLAINNRQTFELDEGDDEDDIKVSRRVAVDLTNAKVGTYNFLVKAEYDDGDEQETESFTLKVEACEEEAPVEEEPVETTPVVVQPTQPTTTTPVIAPVVQDASFTEKYGAALLLGLAYIVVIVIGVVLVVSLVRRRS